jgi:hypothetical protein
MGMLYELTFSLRWDSTLMRQRFDSLFKSFGVLQIQVSVSYTTAGQIVMCVPIKAKCYVDGRTPF